MTVLIKRKIDRRSMLRGTLGGGALGVALPFLDCFLNDNGTALASGAPLPVRFGTWFWGLGQTPGRAISPKTGAGIEFLEECHALVPLRDDINYFSNFNTMLDGNMSQVHFSGWAAARAGEAPSKVGKLQLPSLDVLIGDEIGTGTRFRALDVASTGNSSDTFSFRKGGIANTAEGSPLTFYVQMFGSEFADPNSADFKPNPEIVLRQSVLTAVGEQSKDFVKTIGSADKSRLDQYFTSIRQLESQLALQLQKPAPNAACVVPKRPAEAELGTEIGMVQTNHRLFTELLTMAVACNQTRVFNMTFSPSFSTLRKLGEAQNHHNLTHEEPVDSKLGYQPQVAWFNTKQMEAFAYFVAAFKSVREGDGTLLDNVMIYAHSDTNNAKLHAIDGVPVMFAGKAGGRLKTGYHIDGNGDAITRIGLTALQVMGVPVGSWGTGSMNTTKPLGEILV